MDRGAAVAATMATATGTLPARGRASAARVSERAGVAWDETGTIVYTGRADGIPWPATIGDPVRGCLVPGFVDCHVHLPFYGWRAAEFEARVRGTSYAELHRSEGGIFSSSRLLNGAGDDEVIGFCKPLLEEMLAHGTTALELKTGYGLGLEAELRQARLARRLAQEVEQACTVTLLACHAIPEGISRQDWVRTACGELIPSAAAEGLVDAVDIYVEDIAFTLDDLEAVAEAAGEAGLPLRVHADQLGPTGATTAAVRLGARSADHLNHCGDDGVAALGSATATVAGLLPASSFFLGAGLPPARAIRDAGAAVAVATDFNPGTSPTCSMPETIAMAATLYGLPPLEALTAATANPAWVLGLDERLGTLEVGKRADLLLLEEPSFAQVPYRPGHNPVTAVVVGGRLASAARPGR